MGRADQHLERVQLAARGWQSHHGVQQGSKDRRAGCETDVRVRLGEALIRRVDVDIDLLLLRPDFHRTLCRLTGNETLLHVWQSLEGNIRMPIMCVGLDRAVQNVGVRGHSDIVDAIETGDALYRTGRYDIGVNSVSQVFSGISPPL